ncbi:uncharacterized protein B0H18DRAFT_622868 [Fomitopsis serialis]|uniref:uncharacterized protein n=1 Tax=Fomitopsis serialis TaxID=139415 RepID=UPI00200722AD|nr:uncharacterized protein B0H18DRAFT_622868 [Neoantrodia serialis]KAH9919848.1 hypothetical protein B0H18DRAFT_622868 [Neoantrodia serialis]
MNLEAYTGCYVPRDAGDVLRTERILHDRMGLPLPLVWQILETAEYWVRSVASCGDLTVAADNVAIRESLCCTASIPSGAKKYRPLRRIVFTIESRDQGWRTTTGDDSWTWFEADSKAAWRRAIVTNDPASADFCTHRIQWDTTASDDGFAVDAAELHEWMGRFARGDEISVFARAQYRAGANHARKVVVELYCACV